MEDLMFLCIHPLRNISWLISCLIHPRIWLGVIVATVLKHHQCCNPKGGSSLLKKESQFSFSNSCREQLSFSLLAHERIRQGKTNFLERSVLCFSSDVFRRRHVHTQICGEMCSNLFHCTQNHHGQHKLRLKRVNFNKMFKFSHLSL